MGEGVLTCSYCGSEWPADLDLRFCGECGRKLGSLSPEITDKERRRLTVLFAGLDGLSGTGDGDTGAATDAVDSVLSALGGVVESYGGYVDKYLGDAIMAVFGAPEAHEDDPLRAVRTGFEMRECVAERDAALSLSVGINTGEVIWSRVGGEDYTVTGDAVNVAKRLEATADGGTVLVSESIKRRTDAHVRHIADDPVTVDGQSRSVRSYVAAGLDRGGERTRQATADDRFVGRSMELDRLLASYEASKPAALAVTGPAGIGKTSLLDAFRRRLDDRPADPVVAVGHCSRYADDPLEPFGDILLSRADTGRGDPDAGTAVVRTVRDDFDGSDYGQSQQETFAELLALSAGLSVSASAVPDLSPDRLQERAREAWLAWLAELASQRPVVLQIEDVQWADRATRKLLAVLGERLQEQSGAFEESVTLIASLRPDGEVPEAFDVVELQPLPTADSGTIAEAVLDGPVRDEFAAFLHDEAGGNPYFMVELLRYLREQELVSSGPDGYALAHPEPGKVSVPETLDGLLVGRIDTLDPNAKETLKGASVVGQQFWVGHLDSVLQRETTGPVETLSARGLVHPRQESTLPDDSEYSFEHALLRDAAYELLPKSDRKKLHGGVAAELVSAVGDESGALAPRIASHFDRGEQYDRAVEWYRRAGDHAADTYALEDALDHYERGLSLAEEHDAADDVTVARLHVERADVLTTLGEFDDARETVREGLSVAPDESLEACRLYGLRSFARMDQGEFDGAREAARKERDLAASIDARTQEGHAIHTLGEIAMNQAEYDQAREYLSESLAIQRETGNRERECESLETLGIVAHARGEYDQSREYFEEALEVYREIGSRPGEASSLNSLGIVATERGELDLASEYYQESITIKRELGDKQGTANTLLNTGTVAQDRGAYDEAAEYFEEALALQREIGDPKGEAASLDALGTIAKIRGEYGTARENYEESLAIRREIGDRKRQSTSLGSLGNLALSQGEFERARECAEEALAINREIGSPKGEAGALAGLGRVAREQGAYEQATEQFEESLAISREIGDPKGEASALADLGIAAREQGAYDDARAHFEEALALRRELGDSHGECKLHNELGAVTVAAGNQDVAREHFETALSTARELGVEADVVSLRGLGTVARLAGEFDRAREQFEAALDAYGASGDRLERERIRLERARLALACGDVERARDCVTQARETVSEWGATHREARCRALQGEIAAAAGAVADARNHWQAALETFETVGAPQDALATLEHLVATCREVGDEDAARDWCRRARDRLDGAPDPVVTAHEAWVRRHADALDGP